MNEYGFGCTPEESAELYRLKRAAIDAENALVAEKHRLASDALRRRLADEQAAEEASKKQKLDRAKQHVDPPLEIRAIPAEDDSAAEAARIAAAALAGFKFPEAPKPRPVVVYERPQPTKPRIIEVPKVVRIAQEYIEESFSDDDTWQCVNNLGNIDFVLMKNEEMLVVRYSELENAAGRKLIVGERVRVVYDDSGRLTVKLFRKRQQAYEPTPEVLGRL